MHRYLLHKRFWKKKKRSFCWSSPYFKDGCLAHRRQLKVNISCNCLIHILGECVNCKGVENDSGYVTFWPSSRHPYRTQEPGLQKLKFQVLVQADSVLVYRKNINFLSGPFVRHKYLLSMGISQNITPSS